MSTPQEIWQEAKIIFDKEIDHAVKELERALSGFGVLWTRSGIIKATSLLIGMAGGLATFDFTGNHYLALSASMGLGLTAFGLSEFGDRKAARESAPCSYLLNLRREFGELGLSTR